MIVKSAANGPKFPDWLKRTSKDLFTDVSKYIDKEISNNSQCFLHYSADHNTSIDYDNIVKGVQCMDPAGKEEGEVTPKKPRSKIRSPSSDSESRSKSEDDEESKSSKLSKFTRRSITDSGRCAQHTALIDNQQESLAIAGILFRKLLFIFNAKDDNLVEGESPLETYVILFEYLWQNRPFRDMSQFNEDSLKSQTILEYAETNDFKKVEKETAFNFQSIFFIYQLQGEIEEKPKNAVLISEITPNFKQICKNLKYSIDLFYDNLKNFETYTFVMKNKKKKTIRIERDLINLLKIQDILEENIDNRVKQQKTKTTKKKHQKYKTTKKRIRKKKPTGKDYIMNFWTKISHDDFVFAKKNIFSFLQKLSPEISKSDFFKRLTNQMVTIEFWKNLCWQRLNSIRLFFNEQLKRKKKFKDEFNDEETAHILNKNVSLANIKFSFSGGASTISFPLYDPNRPIFSTLELDYLIQKLLKREQKEALLKVGYDLKKSFEEVKNFYQLNHSEKAILAFIYENSKMIIATLLKKLKDENLEITTFESIEIELYTFRDLCRFCEISLSIRNTNLFITLMKDFLELSQFKEKHEMKTSIIKKATFTAKLPDSLKEKNISDLKKSKYLWKDYQQKDFFSLEFLINFLNFKDDRILTEKRTYFVSSVRNDEQKFKEIYYTKYILNEYKIAYELNNLNLRKKSEETKESQEKKRSKGSIKMELEEQEKTGLFDNKN